VRTSTRSDDRTARRRTDNRIVRALLVWGCNVVALLVADLAVHDLRIDPEWRAVTAGAVFGIVNWAVKPIVRLLALPLIVITLGIALFFVNLFVLYIASWLSSGFVIESFGGAVGGTIVLWAVNTVLFMVLGLRERGARRRS
jgi:putative membrane protein